MRAIIGSSIGRWVLGTLVTVLLGAGGLYLYNENLRDKGAEECIQKVNEETHQIALEALADAHAAIERLRQERAAAEAAAAEADARRADAETRLGSLREEMETQKNEDPEYREWANTTVPDAVVERLLRAAGDSGSGREDDR